MLSENFTVSPLPVIRGRLHLRLDGQGTVSFGLASQQGQNRTDFLGGFQLSVYPVAGGANLHLLRPFSNVNVDQVYPLPAGARIAPYTPGEVLQINWSINQGTRTFSVSANGGSPQSIEFPAISGGIASTPMQQLAVVAWVERIGSNTVVFMDELYAEEHR